MLKKALFTLSILLLFLVSQKVNIEINRAFMFLKEIAFVNNDKPKCLQEELKCYKIDQHQDAAFCLNSRIEFSPERNERPFRITTKLLELFLLKEQKVLNKTSEILLITQSTKFSTLRMHSGHWIYVLRKIII